MFGKKGTGSHSGGAFGGGSNSAPKRTAVTPPASAEKPASEAAPAPVTFRVRRGGPEPWTLDRDGRATNRIGIFTIFSQAAVNGSGKIRSATFSRPGEPFTA